MYLLTKLPLEQYRSIQVIEFNPATGALAVTIGTGVDVEDQGTLRFVETFPSQRFDLSSDGQLLDTPVLGVLDQLAQSGVDTEGLTMKGLIVALISQAIEQQVA